MRRLHDETMKVLRQSAVLEKFNPQGIEPLPLKPEDSDALIRERPPG